MNIKVLVVTNMYPTEKDPFYGTFIKEQVESLRKEGVIIDVVFINGKEKRLNYFTSIIPLLKKLNSNHYDIIHAHHTYCVYHITIVKALLRIKTPLLLTFHEGEVHKPKSLKFTDIDFIKKLVFSKKIKKAASNMVDMVITVEERLLTSLNSDANYVVLPCGVDLDLFRPMDKQRCRKKLNLPMNKRIILFPASPQRREKGFNILIEAIESLRSEDIHLVTGGRIPRQDMPHYMNAADVIVQLSIYEASPMVVKEALAVSTPIVFTDVGDAKAIMGNTKGCFICERISQDVATKLENAFKLNGNSRGRERMLEAGLGLSQVARRIMEIYDNILETT